MWIISKTAVKLSSPGTRQLKDAHILPFSGAPTREGIYTARLRPQLGGIQFTWTILSPGIEGVHDQGSRGWHKYFSLGQACITCAGPQQQVNRKCGITEDSHRPWGSEFRKSGTFLQLSYLFHAKIVTLSVFKLRIQIYETVSLWKKNTLKDFANCF